MRKNLLLFLVLGGLVLVTWKLYQNQRASSFAKSETNFAFETTDEIQKIFFGDKDGQRIVLERKGNDWILNGLYLAREDVINNLLNIITKIEVKRSLNKESRRNVFKWLSSENTRVEYYDADGDLLKAYFVGLPSPRYKGNFMMMVDADQPFEVYWPGFRGFISTYFSTDVEDWMSLKILDLKPSQIQSVRLEYSEETEMGYNLSVSGPQEIAIEPIAGGSGQGEIRRDFAFQYLGSFQGIYAESYELEYAKKDSLLASPYFARMAIQTSKGEEMGFRFFWTPEDGYGASDVSLEEVPFSTTRFICYMEHEDLVCLVQTAQFAPMWRRYRDFLGSD